MQIYIVFEKEYFYLKPIYATNGCRNSEWGVTVEEVESQLKSLRDEWERDFKPLEFKGFKN